MSYQRQDCQHRDNTSLAALSGVGRVVEVDCATSRILSDEHREPDKLS